MRRSSTELRSLFHYDPASGEVRWAVNRKRARAGEIAGYLHQDGYRKVRLDGVSIAVHQVIWALVTGEWPPRSIDHINGEGADNRWANLRLATVTQNNRNSRPYGASGFKGVYQRSARRWSAQIRADGQGIYLGYFASAEDAARAYDAAALRLYGEFGRLNFPQQPASQVSAVSPERAV